MVSKKLFACLGVLVIFSMVLAACAPAAPAATEAPRLPLQPKHRLPRLPLKHPLRRLIPADSKSPISKKENSTWLWY